MIDTLNKKEINRLILLGIKLQLALSCDINHTGLPCRTDRLKAVEYMIEYLKIHNEKINMNSKAFAFRVLSLENFNHADRIAKMLPPAFQDVAYLHDVVEDTKYGLNDLRNQIALNVNEIQAIDLLTRQKDQTYFEYIAKIKDSKNELAIRVKLADIRDHLNLKETLKPSLEKRYRKAFKILTKNKLKGKEDYE